MSDFDQALDELSSNLGLEWAKVTEFEIICEQPNGIVTADMKVVYSTTGPPHYEIIRVAPARYGAKQTWAYITWDFGPRILKMTINVSQIPVTCGSQHTITLIVMGHLVSPTTHFKTPD